MSEIVDKLLGVVIFFVGAAILMVGLMGLCSTPFLLILVPIGAVIMYYGFKKAYNAQMGELKGIVRDGINLSEKENKKE